MQYSVNNAGQPTRTIAVLLTALYALVLLHNLIPHCHGAEHCAGGHVHSAHQVEAGHELHVHGHTGCCGDARECSSEKLTQSAATWYSSLSAALADLHHATVCASNCLHLLQDVKRGSTQVFIPMLCGIEPPPTELTAAPSGFQRISPRSLLPVQSVVLNDAPLRAPPTFS